MRVFTAKFEVPDDASYYEIEDKKCCPKWKETYRVSKEELMSRTDLDEKCGSCIFFNSITGPRGGTSKGLCEYGKVGIYRSHKKCGKYTVKQKQ